MTTTFIIPSILLLATFAWHTRAETLWTTESHAEEEEEKRQNVVFGNVSFQGTFPTLDSSTQPNSIDKLLGMAGNALWDRGANFSEYDELHDDSKHDASPENSVDRDSLENVNYFLQENPDIETSTHLDLKRERPTSESAISLLNEDHISPTLVISTQNDRESSTSNNCSFGDRKCKSSEFIHTDELESKFKDKVLPLTSVTLSSSSLWNVVKSWKPQEYSSETLDIYASTPGMSVVETVTMSASESATAQTSENIIVIEGTELNKDESVIQSQHNKSDKFKPMKHDNLDEIASESTLLKIAITPMASQRKETSIVPDMHHLSSFLFTRILDFSSTPSSETSFQTSSLITSMNYQPESKSNVFLFSRYASDEKTIGNTPSVDHSKELLDFTTPSSIITPTVSRYNAKSNIPTSEHKPVKVRTEKLPDVTPVIFPSFQESTPLIKTTSSIQNVETVLPSFTTLLDVSSYAITISTPKVTTPAPEMESPSQPVVQESTALATEKEDLAPPPRLSNPSCSSLPVCIEITLLETTWDTFCGQVHEFREFLSKSVSHYTRPVHPHHIVLDAEVCAKGSSIRPLQSTPDVAVSFYVTDDSGEYEERLTEICGVILRKWAPTAFRSSVMEVRLYSSEAQSTPMPLLPELNSGFVAAVSISAVAGVALCLLCILLVIMKQKLMQGRSSDTTTPTADAYSLDSLSINASFRRRNRRSARSYLNHAFSDQEIPSHPLNEKTLVNCLKSRDLLEEEFKKIPLNMPKMDSIPEGAHVKNRYSNILPNSESRVVLAEPSGDPLKCYINANFVKGYEGKSAFYIACQAPLPEGIEDFWRMVWEQQCRAIVMLTQFEENGATRCAMYFPQSTLVTQPPFGDFQISLLKKDVYEFHTMSTLRLLDLEKNLFRDIVHLWFTGWPDVGVPKDPSSLITFVQQCRPYINCNSGPTIVHCSTGTGRTGVFLTLDICMREYEESRSIDILQCVSQLRRDRGGAVQNKDQYILIYEAMLEYISRVANQSECPSLSSKNF